MPANKSFTFRPGKTILKPQQSVPAGTRPILSVTPSTKSNAIKQRQLERLAQQQAGQQQADKQPLGETIDLSVHPATASLMVANDQRQLQCTRSLLAHAKQLQRNATDLNLIIAHMAVEQTSALSATAASRFLVRYMHEKAGGGNLGPPA